MCMHIPDAPAGCRRSASAQTGRFRVAASARALRTARIDGAEVRAWAGPWPVHEKLWDRTRGRSGHRLQIVDEKDRAWLVFRAGTRWWAEGRYR